jgi:glutamate synthase (NADPH/NADH) large chain
VPGKSDSAQFDNLLELLHLGGRSLPHAMMMMIPEAWEGDPAMDPDRKAFYRYAASLVEPWDGPAAMVFTDGYVVGATLDRNGLRPARWWHTTDDRVILASETGVIDVPPERIVAKGRLQPGRMFVVDTDEGRIVSDDELKRDVAGRFPYKKWLDKNVFEMHELDAAPPPPPITGDELFADSCARSATATRTSSSWSRRWPTPARSRSARWAPTRRSPRCRPTPRPCRTTSTSCSRRSPTRRSIRSARRW